jgi:hypothetical protein
MTGVDRPAVNKYMAKVLDEIKSDFAVQEQLTKWANTMEEGILKDGDVTRVEVNDNGTLNLFDFTLPSRRGRRRINVSQEHVEPWIMEAISMLRIAECSDLVPALGFKVSDQLYYVLNKEGETK